MRHMLTESAKENNTSPEQQQRNAESVNKMVSTSVKRLAEFQNLGFIRDQNLEF